MHKQYQAVCVGEDRWIVSGPGVMVNASDEYIAEEYVNALSKAYNLGYLSGAQNALAQVNEMMVGRDAEEAFSATWPPPCAAS